jgi:hypothetical protein
MPRRAVSQHEGVARDLWILLRDALFERSSEAGSQGERVG